MRWPVRSPVAQAITCHVIPSAACPSYRRLYGRADVFRIVAREHTGLLHGRIQRAPRNSLLSRPIPQRSLTFSRPPYPARWHHIGDLCPPVLLASVAAERARNYLQADRARAGRRDGNWPWSHHRSPAPLPNLHFFSERRRCLRGRVSALTGCFISSMLRHPAAASCFAFTRGSWVQSGTCPGPPRQLKPASDAVSKGGQTQDFQTPSLTPGCSGCQALRASCWMRFLQLFPDTSCAGLHQQELQLHHSLQEKRR